MNRSNNTPKVLVLSGSIRNSSTSQAIGNSINKAISKWATTSELLTCNELPLFSEDLEGKKKPLSVCEAEDAINRADGLIICSPEYNASVPGGIKNFLDWLSRPHGKGALKKKVVSIIIHTPFAKGGYGAYCDLSRILSHMGNYVHHHTKGRVYGFRERDGALLRTWSDELDEVIEDYRVFLEKNVGA
jgi:chromate reductase